MRVDQHIIVLNLILRKLPAENCHGKSSLEKLFFRETAP